MGIAAFVVDSAYSGGRGIVSTMDNQAQLNPAANDADALFALKLLSTDPRIDPHKIGQIGFSREKYPSSQAVETDYKNCISKGVSAGANIEQGNKAEADVKDFLIKTMALKPL